MSSFNKVVDLIGTAHSLRQVNRRMEVASFFLYTEAYFRFDW